MQPNNSKTQFMRRREAADYLRSKYGFGSSKTLAKAVVVGNGPEFRKCGRLVLYEPAALDEWAQSKISAPVRSSSEYTALADEVA